MSEPAGAVDPAGSDADRGPGTGDPDPWQGWKKFGLFLGGGFLLVFVIEMVALVSSLGGFEMGHERGAVWAMLLMIFATLLAVVVIGGGLFLAIRREGRGEGERSVDGRR